MRLLRFYGEKLLLVMRRFLDVGLDALQFHGFHGAGLALDFFLETLQRLALFNEDVVHLLDLVFEVREVRFELVHALGIFV